MDSASMIRRLAAMIGLLLMSSATAYAGFLKRDIPGYNPATRTMSGARQHLVVDESGKAVGYYSDGRAVERTIPGQSTVDGQRLASGLLNLARQLAWPLNLGMTAYELVCQTSNICVRELTTGWEILYPGDAGGTKPSTVWWGPTQYPDIMASSKDAACEAYRVRRGAQTAYAGTQNGYDVCYYSAVSGQPQGTWNTAELRAYYRCPQGTLSGENCLNVPPSPDQWKPATEADWNNAQPRLQGAFEDKMRSDSTAQPYLDLAGQSGMPMPVNLTWGSSTWSGPTTTTTLRDGAGNVTSIVSTTPTYTTQVTNNSTTINFSESIKTSTSNVAPDGSVTPGPTSTTDKPADPDQKPDSVELDTVEDTELQTQEVGAFTYSDAGTGGACPADPVVTVMGHSLTIPGHVVCDYAEKLRLLVLLVFGVVSARIVASAKDAA